MHVSLGQAATDGGVEVLGSLGLQGITRAQAATGKKTDILPKDNLVLLMNFAGHHETGKYNWKILRPNNFVL